MGFESSRGLVQGCSLAPSSHLGRLIVSMIAFFQAIKYFFNKITSSYSHTSLKMLESLKSLVCLKMLSDLVIQKAFENLTNNGQEANWTIVGCICQVTFLRNGNHNGLLPASWKSASFQAEIENLRKDRGQFRSAMTKNSNWNAIGTACLSRIKLKNHPSYTFGERHGLKGISRS